MMKMTGLQEPLLISFMVDWGSRLRNSGTAVAVAVAAKTRLPNFMAFDRSKEKGKSYLFQKIIAWMRKGTAWTRAGNIRRL
jgi:hypothetical protein